MIRNSETGKRILKNAAYLAFGSILGRAAMFIVFILVARYFGPTNFGAYNTAFNYVFLMGVLGKLGFDMAIIREGAKNIECAPIIQNKIFPLRFWVSIFAWLLTVVSAFFIDYDEVTLKLVLIMSPIVFFGGASNSGILEHFTSYFKIIEKMQYATYVLVLRTLLFVVTVAGMLFFDSLSLYNLGVLVTLTSIVALFFQIQQAKKFYKQEYVLKIDFNYLKPIMKPILLFGIVSLLFEISLRLNIVMLNKLSNNTETGYYSAAWNLVSIGTLFISSFSTSIFPNSARSIFNSSFRLKMLKGLGAGTAVFAFGCVVVFFISESVVRILYGETYLQSAIILSITIWFLPLRLFSLWGHQILESANYLVLRIVIFLIPTAVNIGLNYALIPKYGAVGSAYAALFSNIILLLLALVSGIYVVKNDERFFNYK
jgi:O-antigen/teichoic acid export membrane protein